MPITRYSVPPFSGKNFEANQARLKGAQTPCAICGRAVGAPFKHPVAIVRGGADWAGSEAEAADDTADGYMGIFGVGACCHKKYRIETTATTGKDHAS